MPAKRSKPKKGMEIMTSPNGWLRASGGGGEGREGVLLGDDELLVLMGDVALDLALANQLESGEGGGRQKTGDLVYEVG